MKMSPGIKRVILDVDAGVDDYLALMILLYAEKIGKVKIEAIICSMGNTTVENVLKNVIRLLEIVRRTDIPLYKGVEKQLILPKETLAKFHGEDGFGDLDHEKEPDLSIVRDTPAAIAMHDLINNNPNEISVICVGPLTNLALAIKLYDDLPAKIKDVWIMGGNHTAVGNATSAAEYNFYIDPEAAYIVLECMKCPIFILPWEPCLVTDDIDFVSQNKYQSYGEITKNNPSYSLVMDDGFEWRYKVLGDNTPALHLLTRAEKKIYSETKYSWTPCDAFLCFCFLNPERHITKKSFHHATIELHSCYTRGQVVLDHLKNKKPNVTIIEKFDCELFKELVLKLATL